MNTSTIMQLRRSGYKVRVIHTRNFEKIQKIDGIHMAISSRGGKTRIEITTPSGEDVVGEAICSKEDNWNRKLGNSIALGRALQQIQDRS